MRGELAPLGISVTVVEPGSFRTDIARRSLTLSVMVAAEVWAFGCGTGLDADECTAARTG
jgi:NAD(P)-dependent dehydrogenase (short-subunit alcohol dehydrogenase family)